VLFRTKHGSNLHLFSCAHLQDTPVEDRLQVDDAEHDETRLCRWTADELNGTGRRYFSGLEEAMEALPLSLENRRSAREIVGAAEFDRVWIPGSQQYIALAGESGPASIYVNRGFADVRTDSGYDRTVFPSSQRRSGATNSRSQAGAERHEVCPIHHMAVPASGVCDDCA